MNSSLLYEIFFKNSISSKNYLEFLTINLNFLFYKKFPQNIFISNILNLSPILTNIIFNINKYNALDNINFSEYNIQILIPILIKYYTNIKLINFIFCELPIITYDNLIILNGIKRNLISKLNYIQGIIFGFYKYNFLIFHTIQIFNKDNFFNLILELDIENYQILLTLNNFKLKFNLIHIVYILGISNKFIISKSRYSTSLLLLNILKQNTNTFILTSNKYKNNYILKYCLNYLKNNLFISMKFLIDIFKTSYFKIYIIFLIDFLIDINLNKNIFNLKDNYCNTILNTFNNELLTYFNLLIQNILLELKSWSNKVNIKSNFQFSKYFNSNNNFYLIKELLIINPLLRLTEDLNILSEISNYFKLNIQSHISNINTINNNIISLRDFKQNQLGFLCIIDTTEGPTSGLLLSLTLNTFINKHFNIFLLSHPLKYNKYKNISTYNILFNTIENFKITFDDISLKKELNFDSIIINNISNSTFNLNYITNTLKKIKIQDLLSPSETLIPFLLYNDPTRCLMGAKMQIQSIPLNIKKQTLILTGNEFILPFLSDNINTVLQEGIVIYVSSYKVIIRDILNREIIYYLNKNKITNSKIIFNETPLVWVGERVKIGQLLSNFNNIKNTELSLGNSLLILYGSYFGFEYEDSIIISQNIIYNNLFSSLHLDIYENILLLNTNEILDINNFKNISEKLNFYGIIKEGYKVLEGDILISKFLKLDIIKYKTSIYKLINNLFGINYLNIIDTSITLEKGNFGRVLKVETFFKIINNKLCLLIRIFIGKLRNLIIGDKLCGRHGNKGIISYISKTIDLPYLMTGDSPDIILGSLSVPSRMNLGQLYEGLVGLGCLYLDNRLLINYKINNLIGINYTKTLIYSILKDAANKTSFNNLYNSYEPGKIIIRDGKSGNYLKGSIFMGYSQIFKLIHMIKDKINYRTTGKYSELTQQPLKGRSKEGGQRFGEMELWALEAYGAAYNLKEILNYKSDDIVGRFNFFNMILNYKENVSKSYISETFKITLKELQGLALNIDMFTLYPIIKEKLIKSNIILYNE